MKRILSLILALIFCLSFIVSCEKEEAPSSSSSQSSSSSESSSSRDDSPTEPEIEFLIDNPYTTYEYNSWGLYFKSEMITPEESEDECYKIWTFERYEEYYKFVDDTLVGIEDIGEERIDIGSIGVKESDFETHIVLGLYCVSDYPMMFGKISSHIGLMKNPNGKYILLAETTDYLAPVTPGGVSPADKIIFVLIPKAELRAQNVEKIDVMLYIHVKDATKTPADFYTCSRYLTHK